MEKNLLNKIDSSLRKNGYSTRTEFIRDSIRHRLSEQEKKKQLENLNSSKAALKEKEKA